MTVNGSLEFASIHYPEMCEWSLVEYTFIQQTVYSIQYTFIQPAKCEYQYTFIQHTVCILYRVYIYTTPVIAWAARWNLGIAPKPFTEDKYNRDKVTIQYSVNTIQCNTYNTTVTEWIQFTRGTKRPSTASPWPRCVWSDGGVNLRGSSVWPIYKNIHYTVGSSLAKCPCSCKAERLRSNGSFLSPLCFFSFLYTPRDGCCQNQRGQVYWTLDRGSRVVRHRFHSIS